MSIPETINCEDVDACLKVKDKTYEDAFERVKDEINRMGIRCYTSAVLNQLTSNFSASCIVGHGGYGVVYQGKFPNTSEQVAIKKLYNKDIVEESETFMAEVRTMSNTNHRNLIKLKGYCFEPNMKALIYEFMKNGSLDNILYKPDTSMEWEKLYRIAVEIAHGLMYLHEGSNEQIIHYDIKAGNVLLDNNHSPKIADFGLAKLIKRGVSGVPLSGKRGTNGYTAPELCTNRFSSIVTYKCDVYSFGMLLFEILGKRNINVREQGEYFPEQVWYSFDCGRLEHLLDNIRITKENRESANILSKVALLCIQYHPEDRPTMKEVWLMLDKEKQVQRKPLIPFPLWKRSTASKSNHQITSGDFNGTSGSNERNSAAQDVPAQSQGDSHTKCFPEEITMTQPSFGDLLSGSEMDDPDSTGREQSSPLRTGNSPSSSFSEAGEDDPLPAIEGLQISGEAFPGQELQVCGYSINGTTSCNFEWVRYLEDGSLNYIDGAKQPNYLVTADDVETYLAIEVQPLDDNRKRKGELVKVFANEHRKITCDSEMQEQIEKSLYSGQATYEVSLAARYLDIWEPAILAIKREGYSIKCIGHRGEVVAEKFLRKTAVTIPYGHPTAFSILGSAEQLLRTKDSSLRDTIVLTMRLFIMRAEEKRKAKKKGISFREMLSILRQ